MVSRAPAETSTPVRPRAAQLGWFSSLPLTTRKKP